MRSVGEWKHLSECERNEVCVSCCGREGKKLCKEEGLFE